MQITMKRLAPLRTESGDLRATRYAVYRDGTRMGVVSGVRGTQTPWGAWVEWRHDFDSGDVWGWRTREAAISDLFYCVDSAVNA